MCQWEGSIADLEVGEQVTLIKSYMVKGLGEIANEIDIHTIDGFQVDPVLPRAASPVNPRASAPHCSNAQTMVCLS